MGGGVRKKSYHFALQVIPFCRDLRGLREYELARQLLKSGTSIGANIEEATAGQSRADFLSRMSIASKEARETRYWLRLIADSDLIPTHRVQPLLAESEALVNILTAIVKTTGSKRNEA